MPKKAFHFVVARLGLNPTQVSKAGYDIDIESKFTVAKMLFKPQSLILSLADSLPLMLAVHYKNEKVRASIKNHLI